MIIYRSMLLMKKESMNLFMIITTLDFLPNFKNSARVSPLTVPDIISDSDVKPAKSRWRSGTWNMAGDCSVGKIRGRSGSWRWPMVKTPCWNNSNACYQRDWSSSPRRQRMCYSWSRNSFYSSEVQKVFISFLRSINYYKNRMNLNFEKTWFQNLFRWLKRTAKKLMKR